MGKWKVVIVAVVVGAVGTAGVFTYFVLPKVYRSSATVDVGPLLSSARVPQGSNGPTNLQGVVAQATSQPTATMPTLLWQITSPANLSAAAKLTGPGGLGGAVSASQVSGTNLVAVSATSHDPHQAAAAANAAATAFVKSENALISGHVTQGLTSLKTQAATVKSQLDAASAALAQAEQQPGAAPSTQSQVTTDNSELSSLSTQLKQAQVKLQSDVAAETTLRSNLASLSPTISTTAAASPPSQPAANPEYTSLGSQLNQAMVQLKKDEATAQALYEETLNQNSVTDPTGYQAVQQAYDSAQVTVQGDKAGVGELQLELAQTPATLPVPQQSTPSVTVSSNPQYITAQGALANQAVIVAQDRAQVSTISQEIPPLQTEVASLELERSRSTSAVAAAQSKVTSLNDTWHTLETNITNAQISQALSATAPTVQVEAPATVPGSPISPKKKVDLALAFLIGLVAGGGLAFVLEQFDNTIKTPEDVRRVVGLPTLAMIPIVRT